MTTRLTTAMSRLHWSAQALSEHARVNIRTAERWVSGQNEAPDWVVEWVERLAQFHEANPAPRLSTMGDM